MALNLCYHGNQYSYVRTLLIDSLFTKGIIKLWVNNTSSNDFLEAVSAPKKKNKKKKCDFWMLNQKNLTLKIVGDRLKQFQ